jgi:uncharacterized membrane protein
MNKYSERGQALIMIALAVVGLVGIAGLVVDGGNAFQDRQRAQNAVDAAALSSAYARIKGGNLVDAALATAAQNGYDNDGVTNFVSLYTPPKDGPHAGDIEYIQVIITSYVKTYFARVIGRQQITNVVEATARTTIPEVKPLLNGNAVVSLAPTSNWHFGSMEKPLSISLAVASLLIPVIRLALLDNRGMVASAWKTNITSTS